MDTTLKTTPQAELEQFLARGDSLYRQQRDRMAADRRHYEEQRFMLIAAYAKQAQQLLHDREDALRTLDRTYNANREIAERKLNAVAHLREG